MTDGIDTPPGIAAVLRELDRLHATVQDNDKRAAERTHDLREEFGEKLDAGLMEQKKTNGRLKRVELWVAAVKGVLAFLVVVALPIAFKAIDHLFGG